LGRWQPAEPARADAPKTDPQAIQTSLASLAQMDLESLWIQAQTACLMVYGLNDPVIQPPTGEQLNRMPELMHAIPFEQSGHFPMLDENSKFNRLLNDFLSLYSGESPRDLLLKDEWKRRVR
jgi:pimeloyl-ACP methyl ester carboxylesterase